MRRRSLEKLARTAAFIYAEADPKRSFEYALNPHATAISIINVLDPEAKCEDMQFAKAVLLEVGRAKAIAGLKHELQLILAASKRGREILRQFEGYDEDA